MQNLFATEVKLLDSLCPVCLGASEKDMVCPECNLRAGFIPDKLPSFAQYKMFFDEVIHRAQVMQGYLESKRRDN